MIIRVTNWKISTLLKRWDKINEQPEYQRGLVWSNEKSALLIDSILRGIDIPKIYLRIIKNKIHEYEVADGQQRLNAIYEFYDNNFKLIDKSIKGLSVGKIGNSHIGGKRFDTLPIDMREKFLNYEVTISLIESCSENEVRTLFGRLQEGVTLNPAEKRHAIISTVGKHIESIVLNHKFFSGTKISKKRYKHSDYLAHVFALIFYTNSEDLKAGLLERMYLNQAIIVDQNQLRKIDYILDLLYDIDTFGGKRIVNKYSFIDIFWFLYKNINNKTLNVEKFKSGFDDFERERLFYKNDLETLLELNTDYYKNLYDYILAFDRSGALKDNIETRSNVFKKTFSKHIN
ncbi:DUF262 domain-containing protein [uncultured Psychroserpens sp.]|uniref:DUF262 domain-containing protein n=1 Tax=uncultured Psychroserpens sp. TaxID=255436 RepID=UPI002612D633|nr:DUF262 domain-containing protein [uncultured Psychroserpens sp.]